MSHDLLFLVLKDRYFSKCDVVRAVDLQPEYDAESVFRPLYQPASQLIRLQVRLGIEYMLNGCSQPHLTQVHTFCTVNTRQITSAENHPCQADEMLNLHPKF